MSKTRAREVLRSPRLHESSMRPGAGPVGTAGWMNCR